MSRMTKQKRLMHDEIASFSAFFDASELHARLASKGLSLATIYRFLNALEEEGSIHSFVCENKKIYSLHQTNHAHFHCEKCGKVKHVSIANVDFLNTLVEDDVCHFQIELTGTCAHCKRISLKR
ncbi:MAG: transcriptional repressor [Nanoarchaeota archaeon]|nr:transcriptional repressor [Nanoarchaeota archaeon]